MSTFFPWEKAFLRKEKLKGKMWIRKSWFLWTKRIYELSGLLKKIKVRAWGSEKLLWAPNSGSFRLFRMFRNAGAKLLQAPSISYRLLQGHPYTLVSSLKVLQRLLELRLGSRITYIEKVALRSPWIIVFLYLRRLSKKFDHVDEKKYLHKVKNLSSLA